MRSLVTVLLLAALALVLTACGKDETKQRNAYAAAVNQAQSNFAASFRSLSDRITSTTTPTQGRRTLQGFENAVDAVVRDLRAIDAPPKVRPLHRRLIREMTGYGKEIHKAKLAFASSAPQRMLDAQKALVRATTRISTRINLTIAAINRALQN
jgi:hypothetical protein